MTSPNSDDSISKVDRSWEIRIGRRRVPLGRAGTLVISRVADQAVLGLSSVLLAWRLGVDGFIPISALLVVNSFAVTGSDFGLGIDLLRKEPGAISRRAIWRVRIMNLLVTVACVPASIGFDPPTSTLVIASGLIWATSSEAFIRKNALIRLGKTGRTAVCELAGASLLAGATIGALVFPDDAVLIVAGGLVGKHLTESLLALGWDAVCAPTGARTWEIWLWLTCILNFAIANIDYLLVAMFVSARAFAIYSLGFRVAALFVAQISFVVDRVALVDFGDSHRNQAIGPVYNHRRSQMFRVGLVAAGITAIGAPVLTLVLGTEWLDVRGVILILACAVPWRMCTGVGMYAMMASGTARRVAVWEFNRLILAAVVLGVGATSGLAGFTLAATCIAMATTVGYDRAVQHAIGDTHRSVLVTALPFALAAAIACSWALL